MRPAGPAVGERPDRTADERDDDDLAGAAAWSAVVDARGPGATVRPSGDTRGALYSWSSSLESSSDLAGRDVDQRDADPVAAALGDGQGRDHGGAVGAHVVLHLTRRLAGVGR